jgi:DNA-binding NarL/FixJ family response regulator
MDCKDTTTAIGFGLEPQDLMNDIILLCDDLIFVSKVSGAAKSRGVSLRSTKSLDDLLIFCEQSPPRCVILDLNSPGLNIERAAQCLSSSQPRPMLVGYGSHVDTATLKRARDAGFDVVWPRSKFVEELESSLPGWAQSPESNHETARSDLPPPRDLGSP